MNASSKLKFCLDKADQCNDAAATAKGEHVQALYRALAEHWCELAAEVGLLEIEASESEQSGATEETDKA